MNNRQRQIASQTNGSIARQRREGAAALAMLLRDKFNGLDIAVAERDDEHTTRIALEIAIICQDNGRFIITALEHYAGSLKKLPGKIGKLDRPEGAVHRE